MDAINGALAGSNADAYLAKTSPLVGILLVSIFELFKKARAKQPTVFLPDRNFLQSSNETLGFPAGVCVQS
jgi:hypothetical protein